LKTNQLRVWWRHIFENVRLNLQILKSQVSVLNFKSRASVSGFLMTSRSQSFGDVSVSKVTVSTTSLPYSLNIFWKVT